MHAALTWASEAGLHGSQEYLTQDGKGEEMESFKKQWAIIPVIILLKMEFSGEVLV